MNSTSTAYQVRRNRKFFMTPKMNLIVVLVILVLAGIMNMEDHKGIINASAGIVTALILDFIFALLQGRKRLLSDGGIITGLIVAMVLSSSENWWVVALTTGIAILSKNFLKIKKKPIFNPAAFGLLIAIWLFSSGQSWWGAMSELPVWSIVLVLIGGYIITQKVNKFPQVFVYLGIYFAAMLIMGSLHMVQAGDALRVPYVNSVLFLAFFMLIDPPTSPGSYKQQMLFGCMAAIVSVVIFIAFGGLTYLLIGLLAANAYNAIRTYQTQAAKIKH